MYIKGTHQAKLGIDKVPNFTEGIFSVINVLRKCKGPQ